MLHDTPLRKQHETYLRGLAPLHARIDPPESAAHRPGAAVGSRTPNIALQYIPYALPGLTEPACELVASLDSIEAEYAAIRRGAGLFDAPHRGTLLVTGSAEDRRTFLNRMITQELKDLAPGMVRQSFWLNRKGRIDADMVIIELGDRMLIALDIHQAAAAAKSLTEFLFAEDVQIADRSAEFHHFMLHGPMALQAVSASAGQAVTLANLQAMSLTVAGVPTVLARCDQTGEIGLEVIVPFDRAAVVWEALIAADARIGNGKRRVRPIGWFAFNIARVEAGTPLFNIDFGPTNLPHESGVLRERVSFTKGCYLGQEVVARMESRGHSKASLVGLRIQSDHLPGAGEQIFAAAPDGAMGDEIGRVTSSTLSPMLGAAPVALAMVKTASAAPDSTVLVNAEGEQAKATIAARPFWPEKSP